MQKFKQLLLESAWLAAGVAATCALWMSVENTTLRRHLIENGKRIINIELLLNELHPEYLYKLEVLNDKKKQTA